MFAELLKSVPDNTNTVYLMQSHLWPNHKSLGIWKCPADKSTSRHGRREPRVRSIAMNGFLTRPGCSSGRPATGQCAKLSDAAGKPMSEVYVVLDQREDRINNFAVDMNGTIRATRMPRAGSITRLITTTTPAE